MYSFSFLRRARGADGGAAGVAEAAVACAPVDTAHDVALLLQALGQVRGDETAGAGDADLEARGEISGELLLGEGREDHCGDV
jgi:hypothetical protein